jgi:hypothetical protein
MTKAVEYYSRMGDPKNKNAQRARARYSALLTNVLRLTFDSKIDVKPIVDAIAAGNDGLAKQEYAKASFNFYMSQKSDDGVLFLNLSTDPMTSVYFTDANELASSKLRLHADTIYIGNTKDLRLAYPQMGIQPTTFGADARAKELAKQQASLTKAAKERPINVPAYAHGITKAKFDKDVQAFATNFAHRKKIYDPISIDRISQMIMYSIKAGATPAQMNKQLNQLAKDAVN